MALRKIVLDRVLTPYIAFVVIAGLGWIAYAPGLHGAFLFDDFANLPAIGATGRIDNWPAFWRYTTSGTADPTGRPLAMLSFLLDARDWPADPYLFKRTNLVLHLLNGFLLWQLLRRLGHLLAPASALVSRVEGAALIGSALWLLHPLLVSTTLYIVQREAMLPATFALLGLLAWLRGRALLVSGRAAHGAIWMLAGITAGTLLGTLSKANGVLLPIYVLLLESVLLRDAAPLPATAKRRYYGILAVLAGLPSLAVFLYLGWEGWHGIAYGIDRPWTLSQRLLTEPGVILDYLRLLWLPHPFTAGLFNDQVRAAQGFWSPPSTGVAIIALLALMALAVFIRRRAPIVSLALLFFLAGHLVESTTIALELYFEHRNYVPALLMFWPLAWWLAGLDLRSPSHAACGGWRVPRLALTAIVLAGLFTMTRQNAGLWGNVRDQAVLWAELNPDSPRAQAYAAQTEINSGHPERAEMRLRRAIAVHPDETQLALNLVAAQCAMGAVTAQALHDAETSLRTAREGGVLLAGWFERAFNMSDGRRCAGLDLAAAERLLDAAFANPNNARRGRMQDLFYLRGLVALKRQDGAGALQALVQSIDHQPRPGAALSYAALLGSHGYPREGIALLDHYEAIKRHGGGAGLNMAAVNAWVFARQGYWTHEFGHLRSVLMDDVRDLNDKAGTSP